MLLKKDQQSKWVRAIGEGARGLVFEVSQPVQLDCKGFGRKNEHLTRHSLIGGERVRIASAYCTPSGYLFLSIAPVEPALAAKVATMQLSYDMALTCLNGFDDFMGSISASRPIEADEGAPEGVPVDATYVKATKEESAWGAW